MSCSRISHSTVVLLKLSRDPKNTDRGLTPVAAVSGRKVPRPETDVIDCMMNGHSTPLILRSGRPNTSFKDEAIIHSHKSREAITRIDKTNNYFRHDTTALSVGSLLFFSGGWNRRSAVERTVCPACECREGGGGVESEIDIEGEGRRLRHTHVHVRTHTLTCWLLLDKTR